MPDYKFCVSLSITHPSYNAEEISKALGLSPTMARNVGEPRVSKNGSLLGGTNKETFWKVNLHSENKIHSDQELMESFISRENKKLEVHKQYFGELIESGGYIEYFIGWFSEGSINMNVTLEPKLLKETADLNITIGLAAYPYEE